MKKFLFVTLSAVVITLAGCLVNTATAAVSYYAYSNNGTDYVPSYVELAFMYSRLNKHQQGINLLNNAILNRNLRDANLFFTRGQIFEMMNNLSEAGKDYREALNICENGELRHNIQQAQQRLWSKSF